MRPIKVLMFGWEFPPMFVGGLGIACYNLVREMVKYPEVDVTFVIPFFDERLQTQKPDFVKLTYPDAYQKHPKVNVKIHKVNTILTEYMTQDEFEKAYHKLTPEQRKRVGGSFYAEVLRFAEEAKDIIDQEDFDIVHCHDWMTYLIGVYAKKTKHKPLVLHIHATAYQASGDNPSDVRRRIEQQGFDEADLIISNSIFTKNDVMKNYHIDGRKIIPVYLGVEKDMVVKNINLGALKQFQHIVLFYSRLTLQKGPEYFVHAAKIVLEHEPNTLFIMAGDGDKLQEMINLVGHLGMSKNFLFTGFVEADDRASLFKMADVFVYPSVSEPFGIIGLESMICGTPIILSKNSGISEIVKNALLIDFWDTHEMAHLILTILKYSPLRRTLAENGLAEAHKFGWEKPAHEIVDIYKKIMYEGYLEQLRAIRAIPEVRR